MKDIILKVIVPVLIIGILFLGAMDLLFPGFVIGKFIKETKIHYYHRMIIKNLDEYLTASEANDFPKLRQSHIYAGVYLDSFAIETHKIDSINRLKHK